MICPKSSTGEIRIIKAQRDSYSQVASWKVAEGNTWAPPVLLQNGILVKGLDTLTLWRF